MSTTISEAGVIPEIIPTPYRILAAIVGAALIAAGGFGAGWYVQGLRGQIGLLSQEKETMTCQNSLNLQTASIEAAARETQTLQAKASEAQRAAVAAQRKTKSALEMIDSLKGQSCAGVVNELWGRI